MKNLTVMVAGFLLTLTGCSSFMQADKNTAVFVKANPNATNIHQFENVVEAIEGDQKITGYVQDGVWHEMEPVKVPRFDAAEAGQLADVGTTAAGLALGFAEANPLGVIGPTVGKFMANMFIEDAVDCRDLKPILSGYGWGATGMNLTTLAVGSFTPWSAGVGVLAAVAAYNFLPGDDGCVDWVGKRVLL